VLIVAQGFVRTAGIENRQLVYAAKDFLQLAGEDLTPALLLEPVKAFFEGFLDGSGQGLSGPFGEFASEMFCSHALDTKGHRRISIS
jgi:hypothetical protein